MEVIKVTPRGFCKGVTRAISLAKKIVQDHPNEPIYILGMLVHNTYVMQALQQLHIQFIHDSKKTRMELLDEITKGIVIFTAHGISPQVMQKAKKKGLKCVDASCPDVVKTQEIIMEQLKQGYEILYIGKFQHPEAEAICSMDSHIRLITKKEDIPLDLKDKKVFVTNQTTMSILDIEDIFSHIKKLYPNMICCEEICNATRIRQEAVIALKDQHIDLLYVVGDIYSNNSNHLAKIAKEQGIAQVYLIDSVQDIQSQQLHKVQRVAVTSGASTPTYLANQVITYLENYDSSPIKPSIDLSSIL